MGAFALFAHSPDYSKGKGKGLKLHNPMWERACSRWHRRDSTQIPRRLHREQARSHRGDVRVSQTSPPNRPAGRPPRRALLLIYLPLREAEWRFCAVGLPAWMPGEPCWAKDGPSRRAHGAGPERGTPERSEGRTPGQAFLGTFSAFGKSASP